MTTAPAFALLEPGPPRRGLAAGGMRAPWRRGPLIAPAARPMPSAPVIDWPSATRAAEMPAAAAGARARDPLLVQSRSEQAGEPRGRR